MNHRTDEEIDLHGPLLKLGRICRSDLYMGGGAEVLGYLNGRGLSEETIAKFGIGSLPLDIGFVSKFMGIDPSFKSGIVSKNDDGYLFSRFSMHRLMIPIYDEFGKSIAVMGRCTISEKKREKLGIPKYINTNFRKGHSLFGLSLNKGDIRERDIAYVVEGNFDVITAYQNGLKNVVATCGTALTHQQIVMLARYTNNIKVLFDNDSAGQESADKAIKKYKDVGLNISKVIFPNGIKDLDEYFTRHKAVI